MRLSLPSMRCREIVVLLAGVTVIMTAQSGWAEEIESYKTQQADKNAQADPLKDLLKPLAKISLDTRQPKAIVPEDRFAARPVIYREHFRCDTCFSNFQWVAPELNHNPLYTEDVALERYGWTRGPFLQPLVSGLNFCADTILLPYQIGVDHPRELKSTLGYHRPGSCAPKVVKQLPWSWKGTAYQAAAVVGGVALFY